MRHIGSKSYVTPAQGLTIRRVTGDVHILVKTLWVKFTAPTIQSRQSLVGLTNLCARKSPVPYDPTQAVSTQSRLAFMGCEKFLQLRPGGRHPVGAALEVQT